jgi:hypothetical protein
MISLICHVSTFPSLSIVITTALVLAFVNDAYDSPSLFFPHSLLASISLVRLDGWFWGGHSDLGDLGFCRRNSTHITEWVTQSASNGR